MSKVACIGAGLVGSAWAVVFARAGHEVAIFDVGGEAAYDASRRSIQRTLSFLEEQGELAQPAASVLARVSFAGSIGEAVADTIHVQESVKESVEVKRAVFADIAKAAPDSAVLASSTSAIAGSQFLDVPHPERALVAHPVNPPSLIPLVELCGTPATSAETIERTRTFMTSLGMKPVTLTREIDGFLLNRLQYTMVAEAMHLVAEGYCTAEDIDTVVRDGLALRWSTMGPFEVAHLNSPAGFRGFVDHLGAMMRHMGKSARTDYDWPDDIATSIHDDIARRVPVETLPERQAWRDANIVSTRRLQREAAKAYGQEDRED